MALADNLTAEKQALTTLLESEYTQQNLRDSLLERLYYIRFLLGELGGNSSSGGSASAVHTSVAVSATNVTLLAADPTRQRIIIINDSTQPLYGKIGGGAASIAAGGYSFVIPPKTTAPSILNLDQAYGAHLAITGIWAAADATGFLNIVSYFV